MLDFALVGLKPNECRTIVDIGANQGQFLFSALAYYPSPRCLVVEMLPDLAAGLRDDPRLADPNRFVVVQAAVGEREHEHPVLRSVHSEASSLLPLNPEAAGLYGMDLRQFEAGLVRVRTLDALCAEHGFGEIDLLKIDVQGYEAQVLRGAPITLAHTRRLIIEVEYVPVYRGQALVDEIRAAVEKAGFEYVCNVTEFRSAEGILLHADALFRRPYRPRISLVMPSFNAARTMERALRSIESQGYPNLQVLCADGGSTDGTVAIIERHAHLVSWWTSEPDGGAAQALNRGFRKADGDVFCWLNADDELAPGALWAVARAFAKHPEASVITGGCARFYADGSRRETAVPDWFVDEVALRDGLEQPSTFWTAAIHRKAGELDESYRLAFDWEWWNRLNACGARFVRVPEVLSHYHFSEDNLTSRGAQRVVDEMYRVTKSYAPHGGRIADVYMLLYRWFDLRGYYDPPRWQLPWWRRLPFSLVRRALGLVYGRRAIEAYNWNWASKQVRGVVWYK